MAIHPRTPLGHVWATVAVLVAGGAWYGWFLVAGAGADAVAYLFLPAGGAVAAAAVRRLCRTAPLEPAGLRFWRRILLALVLITAGYAWLAADMLTHWELAPVRTMPLPAAGCVAVGFGVAMWAVARVPIGPLSPVEHRRLLLDRTIAFLSCVTLLGHFGLAPMLTAAEPWSSQAMVLIALSYLLTVVAVTKVSFLLRGPVDRTALRLIAAIGLVTAAVAVVAVRFGHEGGVPAQAVVMPAAAVLATLAVRAQWLSTGAGRSCRARYAWSLPYVAVSAIAAPLASVAAGPLPWTARSVVFAAIVVGGLVSLRQFVSFRENTLLLHEQRRQEERLQHEVTHDGLTGLANRVLFRDRLSAALAAGTPVTVLLVDLDDFKTVNDSLGHDVGDRLLVSVAGALRAEAAGTHLPVRLAGDEFAVLVTGEPACGAVAGTDTGRCAGTDLARRVLDALSRPLGEDRLLVQASIGVATAEPGATLDTVMRHADVAMYAAKQRGKAGFVRYLPGMEEPVLAHIQLGGELRRGLDAGEFQVHYQPVMHLSTGELVGVEALVRWQHPDRGTVSPAEFIPAAERTGLIVELGRFVLRETCRQTAAWLAEFGPDAMQKAGCNVSARQLHDPDFVADVAAALADSGLPSDRLVLELTESAVLRGKQVTGTLHELDARGIKLALDDFGTGESSLSLLRAFPAAIVKLDKSFVDGIEIEDGDPAASEARQAVARAVVQLAAALRLDTVAEGIENEAQAQRLRELGYTLGQGYHLARPMPAEAMTRLLAAQRTTVATVAAG